MPGITSVINAAAAAGLISGGSRQYSSASVWRRPCAHARLAPTSAPTTSSSASTAGMSQMTSRSRASRWRALLAIRASRRSCSRMRCFIRPACSRETADVGWRSAITTTLMYSPPGRSVTVNCSDPSSRRVVSLAAPVCSHAHEFDSLMPLGNANVPVTRAAGVLLSALNGSHSSATTSSYAVATPCHVIASSNRMLFAERVEGMFHPISTSFVCAGSPTAVAVSASSSGSKGSGCDCDCVMSAMYQWPAHVLSQPASP